MKLAMRRADFRRFARRPGLKALGADSHLRGAFIQPARYHSPSPALSRARCIVVLRAPATQPAGISASDDPQHPLIQE